MKDGLIFYQGPVSEIIPYFSKFGLVNCLCLSIISLITLDCYFSSFLYDLNDNALSLKILF